MILDKVQNIPWLIPLPSRALINLNRKKINSDFADGLANQGRWMIQSECLLWLLWSAFRMNAWARTDSYQKQKKEKEKKTGTYALRISLFPLSAASQANSFERNLKFFAFINLDIKKKKDKNCKAMCSIHLFTNCGEHRRLCGPPLPLSPAVPWLSVRYLGCRLGAAGRFRCCNQTPLIPPRLITRLKFCTNWLASRTAARGPLSAR